MKYILSSFLLLVLLSSCKKEKKPLPLPTFQMSYEFKIEGVKQFRARIALPSNIPGYQTIIKNQLKPEPMQLVMENDEQYAEYILFLPKDTLLKIQLSTTFQKDSSTFLAPSKDFLKSERFLNYKDSNFIQWYDTTIRKPLHLPEQIHTFTRSYLKPTGFRRNDQGLLKLINTRIGDCTEFADLSVGLCRKNNIPAKVHNGYIFSEGNAVPHSWTQCDTLMFDPIIDSVFQNPTSQGIILNSHRNPKFLSGKRFLHYDWLEGKVQFLGPPQVSFENLDLNHE